MIQKRMMATWKIRQIFDGDYGCEERLPGQGGNNMERITRDEAFTLLKKYNQDPFHIQHSSLLPEIPRSTAVYLLKGAQE